MKRRGFLKSLGMVAASIMLPLQLTTFGEPNFELASSLAFRQLAPLVKIPLASIDASVRWMKLLYGIPTIQHAPDFNKERAMEAMLDGA